ncbi:MAG: ATP synthase F1 subunit gamma [Deltaproteobacteria bacterium]|nr:ATP synthase F1 subunit gamma [Deltaproteobacteria bacterium]
MAKLKTIRRRITSVRNTQKITRAMKMVAAARLRRAQETAQRFREYADLSTAILAEVASGPQDDEHPLLKRRTEGKSLILVICADRGLCGAFNGNLCRAVESRLKTDGVKPSLAIVGRKAVDYFERRGATIDRVFKDVYETPGIAAAAAIGRELADRYSAGDFSHIEIASNEFLSMISQKPVFRTLLPVPLPERREAGGASPIFIFEPEQTELLARLLPRYVEVEIERALLESVAAEHAARMTAMDAATNNAEDMLNHLTLVYNRARQSAITSDLMDIVGGAEALHD